MKTLTKLALLGGAIAYLARRRRGASDWAGVDQQSDDVDDELATPPVDVSQDLSLHAADGLQPAEASGISEVDPEPLLDMGEAVDPDAVTAAHESVPAQRDRLP